MSSTPARNLLCVALALWTIVCIITAGCSVPGGQPEIVSDLPGADLVVHVIDVGQGDAILVEFRGKTLLIDAGEREMGERVVAYLQAEGIERLDVVVATHAHSDHIGGLYDVISVFPVGRFIDPGQPHPTATYENLLALVEERGILYTVAERGQTIDLDPDLEVLVGNPGSQPHGDRNEDSVVLKLTYGDRACLLMGDAGRLAEKSMAEAGLNLDADLLKVGHHASRHASSAEFLSAVSPAISIITVGKGNDYGHPHEEVLERLMATGSRIYRTDRDGTVVVATDGKALAVATGRKASLTLTHRTPTAAPAPAPAAGVSIAGLPLHDEEVGIVNPEPMAVTDERTRNISIFPVFSLDPGVDLTLHTGAGDDTATDLYRGPETPVWNNDGDIARLTSLEGRVVSTMEW